MSHTWLIFVCFLISSKAQIEDIYCGVQTCYEVLDVSRDAELLVIQRSYRVLAKKHHPDRKRTSEEKVEAEKKFRLIATAYEILRDSDQRQEYDYMLDHPSERYYNYYRYYRRRYSPKVDVRIVLAAVLVICSIIQYVGQKTKHDHAINYLVRDPKHRNKAKERAISDGLFRFNKNEAVRRLTREEMKEREDEIIRSLILKTVDLKGDCVPPSLRNTLLVQLIVLPYTAIHWIYWAFRWVLLFCVLRRDYGLEEQEFITRWHLGFSTARWEGLDELQRSKCINLQLWIPHMLQDYKNKKLEELQTRLAEDSNYKRYRRYMKRASPAGINLENL